MSNPNYILSPSMGLRIPTNSDPGPDYANNVNFSLGRIDIHDHVVIGQQLGVSAINVQAPFPFNNFGQTNVGSVGLTNLSSTLATSILNTLSVVNGDLYFNDGAGDAPIQITALGAVNSTSSGISSGTATASFSAGVLVINSASNTPAVLQCASVKIGNNSAGSDFMTLSCPAALGVNYTLTFPLTPGSTSLMQMDSSGNITAALQVDNSTLQIATNTLLVKTGGITGTQIANNVALSGSVSAGVSMIPTNGNAGLSGTTDNTVNVFKNGGSSLPIVVSASPATNGLSIIRGIVNANGTKYDGEGFTCVKNSTGNYTVTFTTTFLDGPAVLAGPSSVANGLVSINSTSTSNVNVLTYGGSFGSAADFQFSFIAIGQRNG